MDSSSAAPSISRVSATARTTTTTRPVRRRSTHTSTSPKGVTFASLIDPIHKLIECAVDLNPKKQGHLVPPTADPIVDYRTLRDREIATAIVMNPNYEQENRALIAEAGLPVVMLNEGN
jgi:C-methyltransferase C-terminal domain